MVLQSTLNRGARPVEERPLSLCFTPSSRDGSTALAARPLALLCPLIRSMHWAAARLRTAFSSLSGRNRPVYMDTVCDHGAVKSSIVMQLFLAFKKDLVGSAAARKCDNSLCQVWHEIIETIHMLGI